MGISRKITKKKKKNDNAVKSTIVRQQIFCFSLLFFILSQ